MLNSSQFKFHLARYAKVSEADAAAFVDALTQTLLDQVRAGEEVTIQGLGTFSVISTQQGRRLAFQVDERMRAAVNAPFACFEPVVVSSAPRPIGDDEKQPEEVMADAPAEAPTVASEPENRVAEPVVADAAAEEPSVSVDAPAETPSEPVVPSADVPAESTESEPTTEPTSASEPEENRVAETSAAIGGIVAAISASVEKKEPPVVEKKPETPQPPRRKRYEEPSALDELKAKLQLVKPWMWGAGAGALVVLIVLIVAVKLCSSPSAKKTVETKPATEVVSDSASAENPNTAAVETPVASTAAEPEKPAQSEKKTASAKKTETRSEAKPSATSARKVVGKPSDEMLLMEGGKPKMATLGDGGRLTLVALREFGDKAFWAYIYDVNAFQLGDPNNVPIGKPLYLPNPSYFRIDASDPQSIKRAQNRAMQILKGN